MARTYGSTWAHLHLPRAKRGDAECISVKTENRPVEYTEVLQMFDVVFNVREAGRQKTIREGVKNVHAWVTGEITTFDRGEMASLQRVYGWREVKYNPMRAPFFYDVETGLSVRRATYVIMVRSKVYYLNLGQTRNQTDSPNV